MGGVGLDIMAARDSRSRGSCVVFEMPFTSTAQVVGVPVDVRGMSNVVVLPFFGERVCGG